MNINPKHAEYLVQQLNVLLVDDNAFTRKLVRGLLNTIGVKSITEAGDGIAALEMIRAVTPDVIILDWEMPLLNGPELVRIVRSPGVFPVPDVPIIMLSARGDEVDKVLGLEMGADDYVTKPFSPRELVSRVKANLRRAKATPAVGEEPIRLGDLQVDPAARTVTRDGESVNLTYSEFEILLKLLKSPRRVFTREELMDHLWKGSFYGDLRSVDVHVRHLRQKVEKDDANPVIIRTVRGVGYALGREDGSPG